MVMENKCTVIESWKFEFIQSWKQKLMGPNFKEEAKDKKGIAGSREQLFVLAVPWPNLKKIPAVVINYLY